MAALIKKKRIRRRRDELAKKKEVSGSGVEPAPQWFKHLSLYALQPLAPSKDPQFSRVQKREKCFKQSNLRKALQRRLLSSLRLVFTSDGIGVGVGVVVGVVSASD